MDSAINRDNLPLGIFKSLIIALWLLATLAFIGVKGVYPGWQSLQSDFSNYYVSAKLISEGHSIDQFYNNQWFLEEAQKIEGIKYAKFNPFPPVTAYLYVALIPWDALTAKRIFLILNLMVYLLVLIFFRKMSHWSCLHSVLFMSLFWYPVASNFRLGQPYLIIACVILGAFIYGRSKYAGIVAALFNLSIAIKYFPILYLPQFLNLKWKSFLFYFLVAGVVVLLLPLLSGGYAVYAEWFTQFGNHLGGELEAQSIYAPAMQSWDSLLVNLFVSSEENPIVLMYAPGFKTGLKFLLLISIFGSLALCWVKTKIRSEVQNKQYVSLLVFGALVLVPVAPSYLLLLALPAIAMILVFQKEVLKTRFYWLLVGLIFLAVNLQFHHFLWLSVDRWTGILFSFPRVYALSLLFVFMLILYWKQFVQKQVVVE